MQVIPSIDLERGRSRVVSWPGASTGQGSPTDRPERIAERFVALGAPVIHLVDFDGARAGQPVNIDAIGQIASRIATPIQVAGGLEGAEQIQIAFAAGATRVVLSVVIADDAQALREALAVAGDWLAIGLDPRPDRLAAFPWKRSAVPTLDGLMGELVGVGVRRFVLAHGGSDDEVRALGNLARSVDADLLVAGGVRDVAGIRRLRDAGMTGIILGEALLSGAIDYTAALEAAT